MTAMPQALRLLVVCVGGIITKQTQQKYFLLDSGLPMQTGSFDSHCGVVNNFL